ncbi:ornithine cyclodeaminase family protein [Mycolicibacterium sp. P9-64]|uniref:ornithine cyclodeaminase family protein n=1 Tax=Mycolicibacterium sp. P9-64 TaxID=2024612 RepID=UPI0011EFA470|nr:ornithine cyclodeaminase family protein [Mycolicibacterium sp. P9-64]KAA0082474.1 ornithine cyclodeaminase family protein [Mycolicibacterium sp. P9-64]
MVLILKHSDITRLLDRDEVRKAVELAHAGLARGDWQNPAPRSMRLPGDGSAIPMTSAGADVVSVKLLCDLPGNRRHGLPVQRSTIVVTSALTGECIALLDGRAITAIRTAAVSAVATNHLARSSASALGFVGAGNLAIEHARAIAAVRDIESIVVWTRSDSTLEAFRTGTESLCIPVTSLDSAEAVVAATDIVCILTPAREPVVHGDWLRPGQHVNDVGAPPRPDHREVDSVAMKRARVVVDSHPNAMAKSGAVLLAIAEGAITEEDVRTELGHVIVGSREGRSSDDDITLFESVGIGLQDLATADLVVSRARELGIGTDFDLAL